ncbi:phage tail protein [Aeromonas rivipollensis]|uniref:phage tail protein n=1 Tax=Aeromonas rivipollensis TaxID=948519 RepID=UPI0038D1CC0A
MSNQHDELAPPLPACAPPWWEDGETLTQGVKEPAMLSRGIMTFWQQVRRWLLISLGAVDPLTCSKELLDLLAWERDIKRFKGEPLELFRKRVKYAFVNAQDAGELAGFKRIFERLGIGWCEIHERVAGADWDVIVVEVTDSALSSNQALMQALIQHYGRTCRRYRFQVVYPISATLRHARIDMNQEVFAASLKGTP